MIRVRFAPSPTGHLHIGNARTVLFNWLFARSNKGKFLLRVEDTDVARSKEAYFEKMLQDLSWLGLDWDEGPDKPGPFGPYRQSERREFYKKFAEKLIKEGKAYPCFCSDEELKKRRAEALKKGLAPRYDNRCRKLTATQCDDLRKKGVKPALRFKVSEKTLVINDIIRGEVEFDTALIGDFVIMKSAGTPSFNFAVVCDDYSMEISHVIRGEDHLPNTPKHVLVFEALGAKVPEFAHISLTMGPGGTRLSKRADAASIARYKELGYLPEALVNYIALLGWAPENDKEVVSREEMIKEFKLKKLSKSSESFDPDKLDWMNSIYIRNADLDKITHMCIPYLVDKKFVTKDSIDMRFAEIKKIVSVVRGHLACVSQITDYTKTFFTETIEIKDKKLKTLIASKESKIVLNSFLKNIDPIKELKEEDFAGLIKNIVKDTSVKGKNLYMPLRAAITGEVHGPELNLVLPILGKERCAARVKRALK